MAIILSCLVLDPLAGYFEPFPPPSDAVVGFPGPFPGMRDRVATSGWHVGGVYSKKMAAVKSTEYCCVQQVVMWHEVYAITGVRFDRSPTCKGSIFNQRILSIKRCLALCPTCSVVL